nr:hypothetical protein [Streptomyces gardneri]
MNGLHDLHDLKGTRTAMSKRARKKKDRRKKKANHGRRAGAR